MTDTLTPVLGFTLQTIGGNRNTWGGINNANIQAIEDSICGTYFLSTTGGTTTLTQAQARFRFIFVTGTLSSDATIIVPANWKDWIFINGTNGGFAVLVNASGTATTSSIPNGVRLNVSCHGSGGVVREDSANVGQMAFFANGSVPSGWFECNGAAISRAGLGIDLFARIGTTWGVGNGATTFNIPDAYTAGKFLRSRTASVTVGTAQSDQNQAHVHGLTAGSATSGGAHTHTGTTGSAGSHSHTITITDPTHTHLFSPGNGGFGGNSTSQLAPPPGAGPVFVTNGTAIIMNFSATGITASADTVSAHTHSFTTDSGGAHTHTLSGTTDSVGGTESRPTNLSAILCIKY